MPGKTTELALPYPTPTDKISAYPQLAQELATVVERAIKYLVVNGEEYKRTGTVSTTAPTWTQATTNNYYGTKTIPLPFALPPGHSFYCWVENSNGYAAVQNCITKDTGIELRLWTNNNAAQITSIGWMLIEK